ncbi:unnamed protein product, partial [Ectocarpus sp. 12 AP-2014]
PTLLPFGSVVLVAACRPFSRGWGRGDGGRGHGGGRTRTRGRRATGSTTQDTLLVASQAHGHAKSNSATLRKQSKSTARATSQHKRRDADDANVILGLRVLLMTQLPNQMQSTAALHYQGSALGSRFLSLMDA